MPSEKEKEMLNSMTEFNDQLQVRSGSLPVRPDVAAAERYRALVKFAKDNFEFGTHYDVVPGEYVPKNLSTADIMANPKIKKCMNQPGAEMLSAAWGLHPEYTIEEKVERDDLFAYTIRCDLKDQAGVIHGTAIGMASTNETKYKYRWMTAQQIASDPDLKRSVDFDNVVSKDFGKEGRPYIKYRVRNPEPGDASPTLIMMAQKRAFLKATRTTFAISGLFQQPLEDLAAALEDKYDRESEQQGSSPQRPSSSKKEALPVSVQELKDFFDARCKALNLKAKEKKERQESMFKSAEIYGWKDVVSDEILMKIEVYIDENLPLPEGNGQQDAFGGM